MTRILRAAAVAAFAGALAAQSNVVPGLDGRISNIDNLTYQGRRGSAYPGGEVGLSMLNDMCNPGTVNIPWYSAMNPDHPKFGFLLVRLAGDRLEQISDWSFCKHAFVSINDSGACGTCTWTGGGQVMGVHCSDTYSEFNNANRYDLAPPAEIDPWLGTWNPIGSYFDRGDPTVGGAAATDGNRSLSSAQILAFDDVKNRMVVREADLLTAGASYFYGIQLIHIGESVTTRGDNFASRGCTPQWNGSSWSFPNTGAMVHGSILQNWPGAVLGFGQNGNDDGRFCVAVKTSYVGNGVYHYEYAVHNMDNHRAGATLRVPVPAGAAVTNLSFRDIDHDPLNQWTSSVVGNEVVFAASATNPLEWNTIYNFGFDCAAGPGLGNVAIDEARVGPGALTVSIASHVPGGQPVAAVESHGAGCGCAGALYQFGGSLIANTGLRFAWSGGEYQLTAPTATWVAPTGASLGLGDDAQATISLPFTLSYPGGSTSTLHVCSNGFVSVPPGNGTTYTPTVAEFFTGVTRWAACWRDLQPNATHNVHVNSTASEVRVTWNAVPNYNQPSTASTFQYVFSANGDVQFLYQAMDAATCLTGVMRTGATDPGSSDLVAGVGAGARLCSYEAVTLQAAPVPTLGATVTFTLANAPSPTYAGLLAMSLTDLIPPVDLTFLGMPHCFLYQPLDVLLQMAPAGSTWTMPWAVPNSAALAGLAVSTQGVTLSPGATAFGFTTSNAIRLLIGY